MNNKIRKLQLGDYFLWNNLSREDKVKRNKQIAKLYLDKGPSILNYYNALKAYFGGFNPKNPYLITGEAPSPGWGKQGVTGLHKMMAKLPEAKLTLLAPLAGRSRAATIIKDKNIVEALKHRDEVYRRWASLYKQKHDPTPTTFRTKPAKIKRQETNVANSNAKTLAGGKGNAGGSYSSKSHTIRVTTSNKTSAENLEDIAFHEGIHSYGLGESPSYVWKSKYLNFPEGTNPYFLDPREIATHGIQQGQNLGIKVGQTYPGREAMIKMIENRPEGLGFGGVPMILYNNAKTNSDYRRLWSLLNGTFKDGGVIIAANARKWKHLNGGILKAQFGTNLDVDNRSDTTRKGYGSMPYFGAVNNSNTAGLWDLMNYNVTGNPNIITGEPVILPGKVNMSLYKDAKYLLKGPQYDEGFVNFVDRLAKGKIKPSLIGTYKEPVTKFVDLESESIPKGYVKGNEVTPDLRYPISEEGLTVRTVKPIKLENPITNEAEAAAARDWLAERLPKQLKTKPSTKPAVKKEEPVVEKKGVTNPKSTSTERYHDNKNYSRKIRQLDKYTRSMETEKASPSNSGNFRVRRARDEEDFNNMENYPVFRNIRKNLIKRKAKWEASGDKKAKAQWMKDYKDALEKFRKGLLSDKHGGIIKADEGTKLTTGLKIGNFFNSDWGSFLTSAASNILSASKKNNYLSEQGNLFKSLNEETYNDLMLQLLSQYLLDLKNKYNKWIQDYQVGLTNDNPSLIVALYLAYQLSAPSISNLEKLFKLKNKAIDLLLASLKANTWIDTICGLAQSGIGLLANKKLATSV